MIIVIDFVIIVIGVIIILICVVIVEAFARCLDISNWVSVLPTSQSQTDTQRILSIEHEVVALSMPCAPATSNAGPPNVEPKRGHIQYKVYQVDP